MTSLSSTLDLGCVMRVASLAIIVCPAYAEARDLGTPRDPQAIYQGVMVDTCGWPDTAWIGGCTGTLVHPRVVVYAASCGGFEPDLPKHVRFGENYLEQLGTNFVAEYCRSNDGFAYCVLAESIELPVVPPLYGCELDALMSGIEVALVGFGPSGLKNWAPTLVSEVTATEVILASLPLESYDIGGSALLQLGDGSWRAVTVERADGHMLMHLAVPWIEESSGIDITPCHEVDGTWSPTHACREFFAGGAEGSGHWGNWCEGTERSDFGATCGEPIALDDQAPAVTILSPGDGEEIASGMLVSLSIDALDEGWGVADVWVEIDGAAQPVHDTEPPYEYLDVPFPDGVYTIVAHASDFAGLTASSVPVTIGVGVGPPGPSEGSGGPDGTSGAAESTGEPGSGSTEAETTSGDPEEAGPGSGGCGCRVADKTTAAAWLSLLVLGLFRLRRSVGRAPRRHDATR